MDMRAIIASLAAPLLAAALAAAPAEARQGGGAAAAEGEVWAAHDAAIEQANAAMLGDPGAALEHARDAASVIRRVPASEEKSSAIATSYWMQAEALTRMNRSSEALPLIEEALPLAAENGAGDKLDADLKMALGRASRVAGDIQLALTSLQEAHDIYAELGETRSQAIALQNIGSIYNDARDYDRVLEYYDRAVETHSGDASLDLSAHNNRANALKELGRYDEAIEHFRQALEIGAAFESPLLDTRILTNIASAQRLAGDYEAAEATADQALALAEAPSAAAWAPFVWGVKAQIAHAQGDLARAARYVETVFEDTALTETPAPFRDFHQVAYEIARDLGREGEALEHHEAFKRLDDQGRNLAASANAALAAAQFDFASQQLEIERLRSAQLAQDIRLARAQARSRTIVMTVVAIGALVFVISVTFAYLSVRRSRNEVHEANRKLRITNQALEKANQAKSNFLAATSHEIRTPLNGILGMTEVMLREDTLDGSNRKRVQTVRSAGETMLALVDDILDLSKMRAGRLKLCYEPFDLSRLIEETSALWETPATAKGLDYVVDCPESLGRIVSDEKRIRQVVFNLVSNAVKFTDRGEVRLSARTERGGEDERLVLTVSDTGVGIPADKIEDIFKSFHQVESGASRKYGGTGLGLAITRNVVRALGGEISVESAPAEGSPFPVPLPLERAEAEHAVLEEPLRDSPQDVSDLDVLIAEDNEVNRAVMEAMLSGSVRSIEFAEDGRKTLEALGRRSFDVILMDKQMPNMDGMAATRAIREMPGPGGDIYIIAVTADAFEDARTEMLDCGMDDFLAKPVGVDGLLKALRRAVENGLVHDRAARSETAA